MKTSSYLATLLFSTFLALGISALKAQETKTFSTDDFSVKYTVENGKIDGEYQSFYANGKKKAEGEFENNYRTGTWSIWDADGNKILDRTYSSPLTAQPLQPASDATDAQSAYQISYNSEGYIEDFQVEESSIVWSKRIWRTLETENNAVLFQDQLFFSLLSNLITNSKINTYSNKTGLLQDKIELDASDLEKAQVVRYKIKESWFFDSEREVMESRIIGICPVVEIDGESKDLCWLYFPELRPFLADVSVAKKATPEHIKTLDDVFFYRFFSSTIYKEVNVYDRELADYVEEDQLEQEAEKIELELIELEHSTWLEIATN